ncbi:MULTISPECIES: flagellar filament capping protein FliD [unclassified Arthrobacter]|uniref:flagellar filament capping protein FliD n=1 Tax=unclassified Arthrobacter TaxID=235627 RepID=UPI002E0C655A|nr:MULTISPECIES: flagellar filament capping protein FliD [unclassified Arthrobacter]MEC5192953.1 flagellar hook-associated protein 2 [Arthrobacter sp. MP_M4]MEC5204482.1 flagellar hook-associated protein 2 [Arthrobacter sp. MP_M7]
MGISLDGLASGLDTTALIGSLMQVEAIPQTQLKNKSYEIQTMVSALQGLNTKVAALATQASAAAKPGAFDLYAATLSSDKVTATTTAAAQAGSIDFTVTKLAQTQVAVTNKVVGWPYTTMTITSGGQNYTVTPLTSSLDDVVSSVNAAGAGVVASKVAVGGGEFRLQFAATKPGEAGAFTITDPGTAFTDVKAAQDAEIELWPGTGAAQVVKSPTNTFADVLPGVSLTAKEITATPVTLTVGRDDAGITKLASDLVAGLNGVLSLVAIKSAVSGAGGSATTAGVFAGDSTIRSMNQTLLSAASLPVGTPPRSPSEIGISITKTGSMEFDDKKFAAALAADPAGVQVKVQEIATRLAAAATTASDKYTGTLTAKITGQQTEVKDLTDRISDWDTRLESRKATLQRTYSGLEVALSNMKAQQAWLSSQLAGLSGSSSA